MKARIRQIIGINLRRFRLENRFSQEEIANLLDISQPNYNRIESGKVMINIVLLVKLSSFYRVKLEHLTEYDGFNNFNNEINNLKNQLEAFIQQNINLASDNAKLKEKIENGLCKD